MPIKVRCPECSKVMGVPDKAAGRAVKCKGCGGRVPVPAAGGERRPVKKKKKKKKRPEPAPEPSFDDYGYDDNMFGGLDLGRAEDAHQTVCPKCTKKVDEEVSRLILGTSLLRTCHGVNARDGGPRRGT